SVILTVSGSNLSLPTSRFLLLMPNVRKGCGLPQGFHVCNRRAKDVFLPIRLDRLPNALVTPIQFTEKMIGRRLAGKIGQLGSQRTFHREKLLVQITVIKNVVDGIAPKLTVSFEVDVTRDARGVRCLIGTAEHDGSSSSCAPHRSEEGAYLEA